MSYPRSFASLLARGAVGLSLVGCGVSALQPATHALTSAAVTAPLSRPFSEYSPIERANVINVMMQIPLVTFYDLLQEAKPQTSLSASTRASVVALSAKAPTLGAMLRRYGVNLYRETGTPAPANLALDGDVPALITHFDGDTRCQTVYNAIYAAGGNNLVQLASRIAAVRYNNPRDYAAFPFQDANGGFGQQVFSTGILNVIRNGMKAYYNSVGQDSSRVDPFTYLYDEQGWDCIIPGPSSSSGASATS